MRYERTEERVLLTLRAELWPGGEHTDIIDGLEEATERDLADAVGPARIGPAAEPQTHGSPSVTIRCGMCGKRFVLASPSVRQAFDNVARLYMAHPCVMAKAREGVDDG